MWNPETIHFGLQKGTNLFHKSHSSAPSSNFPFPWEGGCYCVLFVALCVILIYQNLMFHFRFLRVGTTINCTCCQLKY